MKSRLFVLIIWLNYLSLPYIIVSHEKEKAMPATISTSGNIARINLAGEFDFSSQDELKQVSEKALAADTQVIHIDMQQATFIDSSVIRMFLKLNDTARKNSKSLVIMNCNERIYEILAIGGFDQVFDIR
jgi:anti-anti-sigma factor